MAAGNLTLAGRWLEPKSAPDGDQIKLGPGGGGGGLARLPGSHAGDITSQGGEEGDLHSSLQQNLGRWAPCPLLGSQGFPGGQLGWAFGV